MKPATGKVLKSRRLAVVPEPYPDESLGSWLTRLAYAHHATRKDFLRSVLLESGIAADSAIDIDSPPDSLIRTLSQWTRWPPDRLERLALSDSERVPPCKSTLPESYCPICWEEDFQTGTRYVRRQWRERWGVMCEEHGIPLQEANVSPDALICSAGPLKWHKSSAPRCNTPTMNAERLRAQQEVRALCVAGDPEIAAHARARVLLDLAMIAGTHFSGGSLVQWSFAGPGRRRRLYWEDGRDPEEVDTASAAPAGTLEVRLHALRIATLLVLGMEGRRPFERQEDVAIFGLMTWVGADTSLAWSINRARRTWPEQVRAQWAAKYAWPDRRDPIIWAQQQFAAGPSQAHDQGPKAWMSDACVAREKSNE